MRTIVFNYDDSALDLKVEAFALKASYFLCDEVASAGKTIYNLYADEHLAKVPTKVELSLLEQRYKHNPEMLETIQHVQETFKLSNKVKYRSTGQIAAQKKMEKMVHNLWMEALNEYTELYKQTGLHTLKQLFEDGAMGHYPVEDEPETIFELSLKASDLLQGITPDKDKVQEMFLLSAEFYKPDFIKPCLYNINDAEAEDVNNAYLHTCFTLPNINLLTATELQAIRKHLHECGKDFRQKTDEWTEQCKNNTDAYMRTAYFKECVVPAAATLQQGIEQNETLRHCNNLLKDAVKMEVLIGEIPVWLLWDFYKHFGVIKDDTWNKLQQLKEQYDLHLQRWPVMVLHSPISEHMMTEDESGYEEAITSMKKSILID